MTLSSALQEAVEQATDDAAHTVLFCSLCRDANSTTSTHHARFCDFHRANIVGLLTALVDAAREEGAREQTARLHPLLERCHAAIDPERRAALHDALTEELNSCDLPQCRARNSRSRGAE